MSLESRRERADRFGEFVEEAKRQPGIYSLSMRYAAVLCLLETVWESRRKLQDGITELKAERDKCRRAAQTWLSVVERQCRDVLDATGMHDIIDESGDGDWALVWERVATMGADLRSAQARIAELEEDNAHLLNAQHDAQLNGGAR